MAGYTLHRLELTTVAGLEELLYSEAKEKLGVRGGFFRRLGGRVYLPCRGRKCLTGVRRLSLAEHAVLLLSEAASLEEAIEQLSGTLPGYIEGLSTFSVYAERITKELDTTSVELAANAGRIIEEKTGLRVSLDSPDITFYVEYEAGTYRAGIRLTHYRSLRDRPYRLYLHPSALNPIIAAAMCKLAGAESVYDPYCGSGTIPIECALRGARRALGSDIAYEHVKGAAVNAYLAGVEHATEFFVADAIRAGTAASVEAIVSNPPFGVREKARGGLLEAYKALFRIARRARAEKVIVLTSRSRLLMKAVAGGFTLTETLHIVEGGLHARIHIYSASPPAENTTRP